MTTKHYLTECTREELKDIILYPSDLWNKLYDFQAEDNSMFASDFMADTLGKDYSGWTNFDSTSYTWWLYPKPGYYKHALDIDLSGWQLPEDDMKTFMEKQAELQELVTEIGNLSGDDDRYYDKMNELEDKADAIANNILQLIVDEAKRLEEVTDEQILDTFEGNEMGDNYYYLNDDKSVIYQDITKSYKTNVKKG